MRGIQRSVVGNWRGRVLLMGVVAGALVAACATNSSAASIPGLQDTGVGTPYNPDPAWQITLDPSGGSVPRAATIINPVSSRPSSRA